MRRFPFLSVAIALIAIAIYAWPDARDFCLLERGAFLRGEWWRAFTAHLVHFSPSHLWLDAAVFVGAGSFVERQSSCLFAWLFVTASMAVSAAVLIFAPQFQFYGGLSGIAAAMLFLVALRCVERKGVMRACGVFVILVVITKLLFEGLNPRPLFARFESASIRSAPISHAAGMIAAVAIWCATRLRSARGGANFFSRERLV